MRNRDREWKRNRNREIQEEKQNLKNGPTEREKPKNRKRGGKKEKQKREQKAELLLEQDTSPEEYLNLQHILHNASPFPPGKACKSS